MGRLTGSLLLLCMMTIGALAQAQDEGTVKIGKPAAGQKLAQAECQAAWAKANPAKKDKISAGQATPFITDFKTANSNGDGSIDQAEFMAACDKGLMKGAGGSASTGSGSGTEGAGAAQPGQ